MTEISPEILNAMNEADYDPSSKGETFIAGLIAILVIVVVVGLLFYFGFSVLF